MGVVFDKVPQVRESGGLYKSELVWARVGHCFAGCWWPPADCDCEGWFFDEAMWSGGGVLSLKGLRFLGESITAVYVPVWVRFLPSRCFSGISLCWVSFSAASKLRGIGAAAFCGCKIREIGVPNCVVEIGDRCFLECSELEKVLFGRMSCLRRIGERAFAGVPKDGCPIREIWIPDSVEEIGEMCFWRCKKLKHVRFGKHSCLERVGANAFTWTCIKVMKFPASVSEIGHQCFSMGGSLEKSYFWFAIEDHAFCGTDF